MPKMRMSSSEPATSLNLPMNFPAKRKRVPVHGMLLLDKQVGFSSQQALAIAKRLLNAEKAGHTGTLDPFATGLLPLCFGEATKFAQDLLDADKTYEATLKLGVTTDTGDTEGQILDTCAVDVSTEHIAQALSQFRGPIQQIPPMYSALKRDGKPLYAYAREGITLDREARAVIIHELELLGREDALVRIRVRCSKGTYVRVLGEDIGKALGCGAHLVALRRTHIANLDISAALSNEQLESLSEQDRVARLLPIDTLLSNFPAIVLDEELTRRFRQGQRLSLPKAGLAVPDSLGRCRVYDAGSQLLGTALLQAEGVLAPERLLASLPSH